MVSIVRYRPWPLIVEYLFLKIALEQSTNRSLLMELAALEAKQKNERDHAQVVVDAWHRALSRSDELKGKYEAAIKDSANYPELSDSEWGIPEDPDPLNPLVVKSQQMRKDYYLAWCDENAFRAVDLDGTPDAILGVKIIYEPLQYQSTTFYRS